MGNQVSVKTIQYPSGNLYEGEMKGKVRQGQGVYTWKDGAVYEGHWEQGKMEGEGRLLFPNGSCFQGQFYRNNPHGKGALTTINRERIEGYWQFMGRSDSTPDAYHKPVGKYHLNASVIDEETQRAQSYNGPATLHLSSGLIALPNMSNPNEPVFAHAVEAFSNSKSNGDANGTATGTGSATGTGTGAPSDGIPVATAYETSAGAASASSSVGASASASTSTHGGKRDKYEEDGSGAQLTYDRRDAPPPGSSNVPEVVAQPIDEGQVGQSSSRANGATDTGVAFGYDDPALQPAPQRPPKPINPFDPRNYF